MLYLRKSFASVLAFFSLLGMSTIFISHALAAEQVTTSTELFTSSYNWAKKFSDPTKLFFGNETLSGDATTHTYDQAFCNQMLSGGANVVNGQFIEHKWQTIPSFISTNAPADVDANLTSIPFTESELVLPTDTKISGYIFRIENNMRYYVLKYFTNDVVLWSLGRYVGNGANGFYGWERDAATAIVAKSPLSTFGEQIICSKMLNICGDGLCQPPDENPFTCPADCHM